MSATDSVNIRDCKFLALATNLASASDSSPSETASLQHPAAASTTAASNLLRATKKLSYGSSLVTLKVQEYDSGPFSDMSPTESGNVCHDPGGRCEDDALVEGTLAYRAL